MVSVPNQLTIPPSDYIAYHLQKGKPNQPGVIFLGGFMSDMNGTKATALEAFCREQNVTFLRFDYMGHGQSSRSFTEGTIGLWKDNAVTVLRELTQGPQILVGSSMGGWLMLLVALSQPQRICGLIGIASAPDFTEDLIWNLLSATQKQQLMDQGVYDLASEYNAAPYPITEALITEGRNHLLLHHPIALDMPVHLIHGARDEDVPAHISQTLYDNLRTSDKQLTLIEAGDHRLSSPADLAIICQALHKMVTLCTR